MTYFYALATAQFERIWHNITSDDHYHQVQIQFLTMRGKTKDVPKYKRSGGRDGSWRDQ